MKYLGNAFYFKGGFGEIFGSYTAVPKGHPTSEFTDIDYIIVTFDHVNPDQKFNGLLQDDHEFVIIKDGDICNLATIKNKTFKASSDPLYIEVKDHIIANYKKISGGH